MSDAAVKFSDPPESNSITEKILLRPDARANNGRSANSLANLRPWQPGSTPNPGGRSNPLKQLQRFCRSQGIAGSKVVADIMLDAEEDSARRILAFQTLMTWGFGKPPEYDPSEEKSSVALDFSRLSVEQLTALKALLDSGALRPTDAATAPSGSDAALASEVEHGGQVTIEGESSSGGA